MPMTIDSYDNDKLNLHLVSHAEKNTSESC